MLIALGISRLHDSPLSFMPAKDDAVVLEGGPVFAPSSSPPAAPPFAAPLAKSLPANFAGEVPGALPLAEPLAISLPASSASEASAAAAARVGVVEVLTAQGKTPTAGGVPKRWDPQATAWPAEWRHPGDIVGGGRLYVEVACLDGLFFGQVQELPAGVGIGEDLLKGSKFKSLLPWKSCGKSEQAAFTQGIRSEVILRDVVPCLPLGAALHEAGVAQISLLAIGVEGTELQVLRSFDWRIPVCAISVELTQSGGEIIDLLESVGFRLSSFDPVSACDRSHLESCILGSHVFVKSPSGLCGVASLLGSLGKLRDAPWLPPEPSAAQREQQRGKSLREVKASQVSDVTRELMFAHLDPGAKSHSHSQGYEDVFLYEYYFQGLRGGRYVELGALDGVFLSNTKMYQDAFGWGGVLIEANPANVKQLLQNRPGPPTNHLIGMAVCKESNGTLRFKGNGGGVGGAVDTMAEAHMQRWNADAQEFSIPCKPIGEMLREAGVKAVDLFSLDVEGAELAVLETMDWAIPVCVFIIELDRQSPTKDEGVRALLRRQGYVKSKMDPNLLCHALKPNNRGDCNLGNEVFENPNLARCGVRGR